MKTCNKKFICRKMKMFLKQTFYVVENYKGIKKEFLRIF